MTKYWNDSLDSYNIFIRARVLFGKVWALVNNAVNYYLKLAKAVKPIV